MPPIPGADGKSLRQNSEVAGGVLRKVGWMRFALTSHTYGMTGLIFCHLAADPSARWRCADAVQESARAVMEGDVIPGRPEALPVSADETLAEGKATLDSKLDGRHFGESELRRGRFDARVVVRI